MKPEVIPIDRRVDVADTQVVAVALVGVRGAGGAQEVHFVIAAEMGRGIDIRRRQQRQAALACREAGFIDMGVGAVAERNCVELGIDVRCHVLVAIQTFRGEEAARRDRDRADLDTLLALGRRHLRHRGDRGIDLLGGGRGLGLGGFLLATQYFDLALQIIDLRLHRTLHRIELTLRYAAIGMCRQRAG